MYYMLIDTDSPDYEPLCAGEADDDNEMFMLIRTRLVNLGYNVASVEEMAATLHKRPDAWLKSREAGEYLTVKLYTYRPGPVPA